MGSIVGAVATVHTPYIRALADKVDEGTRRRVDQGFSSLGSTLLEAEPDALVVFSSEHVLNFSPRCAPPFLVGIGPDNLIFHEPHFHLPEGVLRGAPELASGIVEAASAEGVDVAHSVRLQVDHGTVLPLHFMGIDLDLPVVVVLINSLFPPLPSLQRCHALGRAVARYVESSACSARVGLVATGGLSHSVGETTMGHVDQEFDSWFLDRLLSGDDDALLSLSPERLDAAGNGTAEIRNWVALRGAVPDWQAHEVLTEAFVPQWLMGAHQVRWDAPAGAHG